MAMFVPDNHPYDSRAMHNVVKLLSLANTTNRVLLLVSTILLVGCSLVVAGKSPAASPLGKPKALYLVNGQGHLAVDDLNRHPEVVVVHAFRDLQECATDSTISIWIDKNATSLVTADWLMQEPQKFCPLVIVGCNNALFAFRENLPGFGIGVPISGPYVDWSTTPVEPGFSVWVLQPRIKAASYSAVMQGYDQLPTIEAIFAVTDPLIGANR